MSIAAYESTIPVSPALSSSSWSTTSSGHRRPKTLYRKPVPQALEPPALAFNFSFSPLASPDVGPLAPGSTYFGTPSAASSVHHLSLNSPYPARDLSSPEMHEAPSSEDGAYSSDEEIRAGGGPVRGAGLFGGFRLERHERYSNPGSRSMVGDSSKGRLIRDPETVGQCRPSDHSVFRTSSLTPRTMMLSEHIFGASIQRSRRTSPVVDSFPSVFSGPGSEAEEVLVDDAPDVPDYRVTLAKGARPESSTSMAPSISASSAASVASARTSKLLKARRAAAAKAAWKDEFADMAAEERVVRSVKDDAPEAFVFEQPELESKRSSRAPSRRRTHDGEKAVDSPESPEDDAEGAAAGEDDEESVLDRFRKSRRHFNMHLSLPGTNHSSRPSSPISLASIGSPSSLGGESPRLGLSRGASSPGGRDASSSPSFDGKLASGYGSSSSSRLDLASAQLLFKDAIPRICTPEPAGDSDSPSNGGSGHHRAFDFLHGGKAEPKTAAPAYRTRHRSTNSVPGFGLRELREMREAADVIERDARRPTTPLSRSSSTAEKKLKRKPVPVFAGDFGDEPLEVTVNATKASGAYFHSGFSTRPSDMVGPGGVVYLSVDQPETSDDSARTSIDSFSFPHTPDPPSEFGMLAPSKQFGRRRSVSLSDLTTVAAFSTVVADTPPPFDQEQDEDFSVSRMSKARAKVHTPPPLATDDEADTTPPASHTSFFDVVSASHARTKLQYQRGSPPSFSQSPPVPSIPSPDQREVTGVWMPHSERSIGSDASLASNPYAPRERMTLGSLRRKVGLSSPRV